VTDSIQVRIFIKNQIILLRKENNGLPAVAKGPDGRYIMVYKASAIDFTKNNLAGPVVHRVAVQDNPTGLFHKYPGLVFAA
jgi:hypothetical protein